MRFGAMSGSPQLWRGAGVSLALEGCELFRGELEEEAAASFVEGGVEGLAVLQGEARGGAGDEVADGLLGERGAAAAEGAVQGGRGELQDPALAAISVAAHEEAEVNAVGEGHGQQCSDAIVVPQASFLQAYREARGVRP